MSYETVVEQIKQTPEALLDDISYYIDFVNYKYQNASEKGKTAPQKFFALADSLHLSSDGQKWAREELHER